MVGPLAAYAAAQPHLTHHLQDRLVGDALPFLSAQAHGYLPVTAPVGGFVKRFGRPWDVAVLWLAAGGEPARSSSSTWKGLPPQGDHAPCDRALKAQRPLGLCPGLGAPLRLQGNRFF